MAYDFAGSWDSCAGHQSNLYPSKSNPACTPFSAVKAIDHYKSHGVPGSKIIIGMPLYGRAFCNTDGPGSPYQGTGEGSWEPGVWDFKALPHTSSGGGQEEEHLCTEICASWSYDSSKRTMVTYDTKEVAQRKANFIKEEGLGGAMWWESSADKQGDESLISTVSYYLYPPPFSSLSKYIHQIQMPPKNATNLNFKPGSLSMRNWNEGRKKT